MEDQDVQYTMEEIKKSLVQFCEENEIGFDPVCALRHSMEEAGVFDYEDEEGEGEEKDENVETGIVSGK